MYARAACGRPAGCGQVDGAEARQAVGEGRQGAGTEPACLGPLQGCVCGVGWAGRGSSARGMGLVGVCGRKLQLGGRGVALQLACCPAERLSECPAPPVLKVGPPSTHTQLPSTNARHDPMLFPLSASHVAPHRACCSGRAGRRSGAAVAGWALCSAFNRRRRLQ
eukprot:360311-Chlamydomonas_euryale.AAC.10